MPARTLFAYALGTDLDEVAPKLESRLDALVADRQWVLKDVWVVNQRVPESGGAAVEWDLGLNLTLPAKAPAAWTDDVVAVAQLFAKLHTELKRDFVIGVADKKEVKDVFTVSGALDEAHLRAALTAAVTGK